MSESPQVPARWSPAGLTDAELFPLYDQMLAAAPPVAYSEDHGGFWTLFRYADVVHAARDQAHLVCGRTFIERPNMTRVIPLTLNGEEHTFYRRLLNPYFEPKRVAAFEPLVRAVAGEHLVPLVDAGVVDFAERLSVPVPARVLCSFVGVPEARWQELREGSKLSKRSSGSAEEEREIALQYRRLFSKLLTEAAESGDLAGDSIVGELWRRQRKGDPGLDADVVLDIGYQLLAAGHETTAWALTNLVWYLAQHPGQAEELRRDSALLPRAVEESLRLRPPLHELARTAAGPIDVHGVGIETSSCVGLNWAAANRDPAAFDEPAEFRLDRASNRHLTFGHGQHICIGAPLARLQLRVVLEELLAATSSLRLAGEPAILGGLMRSGFTSLPVELVSR
ncbi:MAG TPA: cytochrome P450 [Acidimicrobiales bacterium]|nr:cytochrome P450 [Acidimicrobiales bacterium]